MARNATNAEDLWRNDVVELLREKLKEHLKKYDLKIDYGVSVLKDTIYQNGMLCFNFFEQDIVIYKEIVDVTHDLVEKNKRKRIKFFMKKDHKSFVVPDIIIELKYFGVNSHTIIVYSEIAREIKSIFPKCKYYFAMRFTEKKEELIDRHGKNFDSKFILEKNPKGKVTYVKGQFKKELAKNKELASKFKNLLSTIKIDLDNMLD